MSAPEETEMHHFQEPEWFNMNHDISKPKINRISLMKKIKIIREIAGMGIATIIFVSGMIWLINAGYCFDFVPFMTPTTNTLRPPAIVWYTGILSSVSKVNWVSRNRKITCTKGSRLLECDIFRPESQPEDAEAYLFYITFLDTVPLPRRPGTIWGLLHDESPINKLMLIHEEAMNLFNFTATFSRHSDVPFPLVWMRNLDYVTSPEYFIETSAKNAFLSEYAPVMYMQTDCETFTERDQYVQKLMEYIPVDSYGACIHNRELPLHEIYANLDGGRTYRFHMFGQELLKFIAQYKFIVAIEISICKDYVTEKLWRAIEVGVVPIYYGSPLVKDWLPNNKSAILLEDYPTPKLLSQHLRYLLQNDTAYEEYLEHKTLGLISNQKLIDEITVRPYQTDLGEVVKKLECVVCERIHDKKSNRVNMMTRKHHDCQLPASTITFSPSPNNYWQKFIKDARNKVNDIYEEIRSPDTTLRQSKLHWW